jgi:four helix bundle protein
LGHRAVCRVRSTADFVSKLGIVLEEADETLFWLELLNDSRVRRSQAARLRGRIRFIRRAEPALLAGDGEALLPEPT